MSGKRKEKVLSPVLSVPTGLKGNSHFEQGDVDWGSVPGGTWASRGLIQGDLDQVPGGCAMCVPS